MNFFVEKISKIKTENKPFERSCNCREGGDNSSSNNGESGHSQTHTHTRPRIIDMYRSAYRIGMECERRQFISIKVNWNKFSSKSHEATKRQREQLQQASRYGRERAKINQPAKHRHTKIKKKKYGGTVCRRQTSKGVNWQRRTLLARNLYIYSHLLITRRRVVRISLRAKVYANGMGDNKLATTATAT